MAPPLKHMKALNVEIDPTLRAQLDRVAAREDRTIRSIVERALRNELKKATARRSA